MKYKSLIHFIRNVHFKTVSLEYFNSLWNNEARLFDYDSSKSIV